MKAIKINGREYPCRVTMGALLRFRRETGHDVSHIDQNDVTDLITLLWCCVASACASDSASFKMSLLDFADRIEPKTLTDFYTEMEKDGGTTDPEKKTGE